MDTLQRSFGTIKLGNGPIFPLNPEDSNTNLSPLKQVQQNNQQNSDSQLYGSRNQGEGQIFLLLPMQQNPPEQQSIVSNDNLFGTGETILFQQVQQNQNQQNQQENDPQISDQIMNRTQQQGEGINIQNEQQIQQQNSQVMYGTRELGEGINFQNEQQIQQQNPENNDLKTYRKNVYSKLTEPLQKILHYDCIINFLNQITHNTQNFQLKNYDNNNFYKGELVNEQKHGYGFHLQGKEFYEGYFENDKRQGKGVLVTIDFEYYIGNWQDNNLIGQVSFKNQNKFYDGQCKKNLVPHGKGYLEIKNDYRYKGDFVDGKMHGQGEKNCFNDNKLYIGSFVSNKMQGKGKIKYQNGKEYEGEFLNNKYEGQGILKDSDGSVYNGQFKNNLKHGYGKLMQVNKQIIEGYWEEDDFKKQK